MGTTELGINTKLERHLDESMPDSLAEFFRTQFEKHRHQCAYRQRRGYRAESFSYGEILARASDFALRLDNRGIAKGDRVMVWGENSAEWVAAFFGCALRGVVVVPMDDAASSDFALRVFPSGRRQTARYVSWPSAGLAG